MVGSPGSEEMSEDMHVVEGGEGEGDCEEAATCKRHSAAKAISFQVVARDVWLALRRMR